MLFQTSRRQVQWVAVLEFVVCSNYDGHITCVTYRCLILGDTFVYILIMYNCCGVHVSTWLSQYYIHKQRRQSDDWLFMQCFNSIYILASYKDLFFIFPKAFILKLLYGCPHLCITNRQNKNKIFKGPFNDCSCSFWVQHCIGGLMVSVLSSSEVDLGFNTTSVV
jgi:hypothetical protein